MPGREIEEAEQAGLAPSQRLDRLRVLGAVVLDEALGLRLGVLAAVGVHDLVQRPLGLRQEPLRQLVQHVLQPVHPASLLPSLKYEALYLQELGDGFEARRVIGEWLAFYNGERPHSSLDGRTPAEAHRGLTASVAADDLRLPQNQQFSTAPATAAAA